MHTRHAHRTLALLLAMLLLASCGQNATETAAETAAGGETAETILETEAVEYLPPDVDYEGATFTIGAVDFYSKGGGNWIAQNYCEAYADLTGDPLHDGICERNNRVEEELNVVLEAFSFDSYGAEPGNKLKSLVLAGETVIDMAAITGYGLPVVLSAGCLMNLQDLPGLNLEASWWDETSRETFTIMDTLYALAGDFNLNTNFAPITYFFSKQLVEQNGLDDPYTLVKEGKWTLDKSIQMAEAVAGDTNGNSTIDHTADTFGICLEPLSMTSAIHGCNVTIAGKDAEGKPVFHIDKERAAKVVETMQPFYHNANVTMLSSKIKGYNNVFRELFLPTFQENRVLFYNNQLLVAMNLREMDADFGILPHPKFDEAQENYCGPVNYHWASFVTVPVTNDRPALTAHMLDALGYYSQQFVTPMYVEKTVQGKTLRDEESIEMLDIILSTRIYDLAAIYDWGGISSVFNKMGENDTLAFASTYASKEAGADKALAKTVDEILAAK